MVFPIRTIICPWAHSTTMRLRISLGILISVLLATALCLDGRSFFLTNLQTGLVGFTPAMLVATFALLFLYGNRSITLRRGFSIQKLHVFFAHVQTWLAKPQVRAALLVLCIAVMLICATGYWWQPMGIHDMAEPLHTNRQDRVTQSLDMGNTMQDQPDVHALAVVPVSYPLKASLYAVGIMPMEDRVFPNNRHRKIIGSSE